MRNNRIETKLPKLGPSKKNNPPFFWCLGNKNFIEEMIRTFLSKIPQAEVDLQKTKNVKILGGLGEMANSARKVQSG